MYYFTYLIVYLTFQIRAIIRNRTGIEDWILEKALFRRKDTQEEFIFPYDLGLLKNIKQVVNLNCVPIGDGITWEVAEGFDQYTLTVKFYFLKINYFYK